jgi:hypothetical protein
MYKKKNKVLFKFIQLSLSNNISDEFIIASIL